MGQQGSTEHKALCPEAPGSILVLHQPMVPAALQPPHTGFEMAAQLRGASRIKKRLADAVHAGNTMPPATIWIGVWALGRRQTGFDIKQKHSSLVPLKHTRCP